MKSLLAAIAALGTGGIQVGANVFAAEVADLEDRLKSDLRAQTPRQFNFIERVVSAVEENRLPLGVVDSTYLWARKKPQNRFQYFERAILVRAQRLGVKI